MTREEIKALHDRNTRRAALAREALGTKWLCHPANRVQRKPRGVGVLERQVPL